MEFLQRETGEGNGLVFEDDKILRPGCWRKVCEGAKMCKQGSPKRISVPEKGVMSDSDAQQFLLGWRSSWNPTIDIDHVLVRMPLETSMKAFESKYDRR